MFINKSFEPIDLKVRMRDFPNAVIKQVGKSEIHLNSNSTFESVFFVTIPEAELQDTKTPIIIDVYKDGELVNTTKTNFLGPFTIK